MVGVRAEKRSLI